MKNDQDRFEAELRSLKPLPLPASLKAGIRANLDGVGRVSHGPMDRIRWGGFGLAAAAAALLAFGAVWMANRGQDSDHELVQKVTIPPVTIPEDVYRLVSSETYVLDRRTEGPVMIHEGKPVMKVHYHCVDRVQWHNPGQRATLTSTSPRDEVRLVSMETD